MKSREREKERKWKSKLNASIVIIKGNPNFRWSFKHNVENGKKKKFHWSCCQALTITFPIYVFECVHCLLPFTLSWKAEFAYVSIWHCQLVSGRRTSISIFSQCTTAECPHSGMAQFTILFAFPIASPLSRKCNKCANYWYHFQMKTIIFARTFEKFCLFWHKPKVVIC